MLRKYLFAAWLKIEPDGLCSVETTPRGMSGQVRQRAVNTSTPGRNLGTIA
jgi:hypothetical protein